MDDNQPGVLDRLAPQLLYLRIRPRPCTVVVVSGAELTTSGRPRSGHIRDALGPRVPAWLHRLGATMTTPAVIGPVGDTPDTCLAALCQAQATRADILTTGGTCVASSISCAVPCANSAPATWAMAPT